MTGRFWLDWAILAASLFNMILLIWLGLTVLLNADRRHWGVWLMGGGLLSGALFFLSHTAILGQELTMNLDGLNFWWRTGWFPITISPLAWYVAVLWVSGFWAAPQSNLRRRHRPWLWTLSLGLLGLLVLLLVGNPIPVYANLIQIDLAEALMVGNTPLLFLLFPLWTVTCVLLSIDVLYRPVHVESPTTQTARQRALPWLLATAGTLLAVALVVAFFVGSVVTSVTAGSLRALPLETVAVYDLVLSLLLALSALLLGQAIVSYEIFTGRALPRRSFVRHWRSAIIFAGGYAVVVGWTLAVQLRPIYSLLLATLLLTVFFALYSWRSFWEREQVVARLRPLVQSRQAATDPLHAASSAERLFAVLCRDVLGTAHGLLIAQGSMTSLVSAPLAYPEIERGSGGLSGSERIDANKIRLDPPDPLNPRSILTGVTPLDATNYAPYTWAISLWDERERIGALLIGDKADGGLYTQEEMETAQVAGERMIHMLAGEGMVARLLEIQRKRTAEQRVLDLRTRRTLHDEILPTLHLAVLQLHSADRQQPAVQETLNTLADVHQQISVLLANSRTAIAQQAAPQDLATGLRALVEDEFAHHFEQIQWEGLLDKSPVGAGSTNSALYVEPTVGEVILGAVREVIRNAAAHGRGERADRPLSLCVGLSVAGSPPGEMILTIADDGVGIHTTKAASTPFTGGSGSGLALHRTLLAIVGGDLRIDTSTAGGTQVTITTPLF